MRIDNLAFSNFMCFEDYRLDFKKGINLQFGANGSGKTTMLRGMKIARSSLSSGFSHANTRFIGIAVGDFMSEVADDTESLKRSVVI